MWKSLPIDIDACEFFSGYGIIELPDTGSANEGLGRQFSKHEPTESYDTSQFRFTATIDGKRQQFTSPVYQISVEELKAHLVFGKKQLYYDPESLKYYFGS